MMLNYVYTGISDESSAANLQSSLDYALGGPITGS